MAKVRAPGDILCRWDVDPPLQPCGGSLRLVIVPLVGFYLISPSEFERFSLSARNVTEPLCRLEVARLQDTSCLRWALSGAWGAVLW